MISKLQCSSVSYCEWKRFPNEVTWMEFSSLHPWSVAALHSTIRADTRGNCRCKGSRPVAVDFQLALPAGCRNASKCTFNNRHLPKHILCHHQLWNEIQQVFRKHIPLLKMQSNGGSKSVQFLEKKMTKNKKPTWEYETKEVIKNCFWIGRFLLERDNSRAIWKNRFQLQFLCVVQRMEMVWL